ncbi:MAG: hypothetical protein WCI04_00125 [archaeon]
MKLNTENAKSFNASLKQAFKEGGMNGVKVRIINSYKFPNCWVEVWFPDRTGEFSNDFRLRVFDASGFKREGLLNASDVSYGNIQKHSISAKVWEWEKVFNNEMAKGGSLLEQRIELAKKKSKVAKGGSEVYLVLQHKTDPEEIFVISQFNYNIDKHNNQWNDYNIVFKTNEMANGGGVKVKTIKEADIKVGAKFELIDGQIIEITRLFTENIDQDWCEYIRGGETKENSVNALKIFINNWRAEKKYGVGGTFDSSSTGEVIGGTLGSSESGETIGGTMASSYAKGGMVGYNPLYLLFNEGNSATIRLFSEDHKGSGYYTAIGDLRFGKYQQDFTMSSIDMAISSDHNAPFKLKLMAKVSQFLKDKVGSYASVQEVLGVIGGEELIVADIGRNQKTFLPKSYIGYHVFEVVQKKDGQTYASVYAPNTLKAQKMLDEKMKTHGGSGNYELHSTGNTVSNSRSEVKFKLGGNTASSYSYEIGGL